MSTLCIWIALLIVPIGASYHAEDFLHKMKTLKYGKVDKVAEKSENKNLQTSEILTLWSM